MSLCVLLLSFMAVAFSGLPADKAHKSPVIATEISNTKVSCITQDSKGYIWAGTFRGLNRYNGYEYRQYFFTGRQDDLPDNQIRSLYEDSKGRLWVGTVNGVCIYTGTDSFKRIPVMSGTPLTNGIFEDSAGQIYIHTALAICRYSEDKAIFEEVLPRTDQGSVFTEQAFITQDDEMWLVTDRALKKISLHRMQVRDSIPIDYYPAHVNFDKSSGCIFLSYTGYLKCFDTEKAKFTDAYARMMPAGDPSVVIKNIYRISLGQYIVNTEKHGMFIYNAYGGRLVAPGSLDFHFKTPEYQVNVIYEDREDNLWLGYLDQGLEMFSSESATFSNAHLSSLLGKKSVTSTACDRRGNLYMTTLTDGLYIYNLNSGKFTSIAADKINSPSFNSDLGNILVDSKDHVWIATMFGVNEYNFDGSRLNLLSRHDAWMPMYIRDMGDRGIYISSAANYILNIRGGKATRIHPFTRPGLSFIPCMEPDEDGRLLVGAFANRMAWLDTYTNKCEEVDIRQSDWDNCITTSTFIPTHFHRDGGGNFWIGTVANGLLQYIPDKRTARPVPGAPCSDICAIEEDMHGKIWVSTMYGIGCYDPQTEAFTNYYADNGIGGNQFYERSSCTTHDGRIVFGGTHGVTIFNPDRIMAAESIPLYFEDLKIDNAIVKPSPKAPLPVSLTENPDIVLKNRDNSFGITFAALEYRDGHSVQYAFRMNGYDKDWVVAGNGREAFYTRLPAGRYKFEVMLLGSDIVKSIQIRVKRHPLASWWAICIYFVVICSILYYILSVIYKRRKNEEALAIAEREKEQERKVNQMNMSFFANVSHEFRTPLTMISGPISQLENSDEIPEEGRRLLAIVQRNVRRMLRLVNQMLDFNKLENDTLKLKVRSVDLTDKMNYLVDIFSISAREKDIKFVTRGFEAPLVVWADEDKIDKVCWNLLSNAFKFTSPGGKIEISLDVVEGSGIPDSLDSEYVRITVLDSGPGIPEEEIGRVFERYYQLENKTTEFYNYGSGIGLYYAQALARLHHGVITVRNAEEGGAEFSFFFPMHEYVYSEKEKESHDVAQAVPSFVQLEDISRSKSSSVESDARATVLVVDDDTDVAYYLKEMLSREFRVVTRFNADSAYSAMREEMPDIVLSDVIMNGMNGFELCRKIREDVEFSHIPVILLTAKTGMENQIEGLNVGADAYVQKPFDPEYLLTLIHSTLRNRERLKKLLGQSTQADNISEDALPPQDKAFMTALYEIMEKEFSNSELDIQKLSTMLGMSRTKLYYKVKGLTGENPGSFFKRYKLNRAAQLILDGKYILSEIADMSGFSTPAHFSTSFKKQFGVTPSQYGKE